MKPHNKTKNTPALAGWLLKQLFPEDGADTVVGDFAEEYNHIAGKKGIVLARIWLWTQILISLKPYIIYSFLWRMNMFKNYLKVALRNILKHKGSSFINVFGLAIGLACTILISLWVTDELSYDRFHKNARNLFCVYNAEHYNSGKIVYSYSNPVALGPALKSTCPEILKQTRYIIQSLRLGGEERNFVMDVAFVDPSFLKMFSFPLLKGNINTALKNPYSIVLTEKSAARFYGSTHPLEKSIKIGPKHLVPVTGVMANIPRQSQLQFDCLIPISSLKEFFKFDMNNWGMFAFKSYVQLPEGVNHKEVERKIAGIIKKHNKTANESVGLQPLTAVHLHDLKGEGLMGYVYIFSAMGILILLVACINYMSLATARSTQRAMEVGLRKVVGASRTSLYGQFMGESILLSFCASCMALIMVHLVLPYFNQLAEKDMVLSYSFLFIIGLTGIALFTSLFAGSYPALVLSALKPVQILKRSRQKTMERSWGFRRILVTLQFSLSIFLIIGVVFIYKQMQFIQNKNLGFHKENIICMRMDGNINKNYKALKDELLKNPHIINMARSNATPEAKQSSISGHLIRWEGKQDRQELAGIHLLGVDYDFMETYGISMAEGRFFDENFSTDWGKSVILNETAIQAMGINSPVGKQLYLGKDTCTIVGVIKDFHFRSLHHQLEPLLIVMNWSLSHISIRLKGKKIQETLQFIKRTLKKIIPGSSFLYEFFDERLQSQYKGERRMEKLVRSMALLAILISCLGLFGLASFTTQQRTKEIGIRKVLGASVGKVILLLTSEFSKWVIAANLIAWPMAYWSITKWLQGFAYRAPIEFHIFLISAAMVLLLALLTVSYQSFKAARTNPVESLKYE